MQRTSGQSRRKTLIALAVATALGACAVRTEAPTTTAGLACDAESLSSLKLDGVTIGSLTPVPAGSYTPAGTTTALPALPAFCVVKGEARPSADSLVNFEAWVPARAGWNGKLVVTGNGGYSPALSHADMAYALRQGYAAVGGDTGHQVADGNDMRWGVGHPEKIVDWGTRSIHAITVPGKQIVAQLQSQAPTRAYFYGCSTGGHQGYAEVQRYPQDFDGVIAGAPGNNRVALNAEFLWRYRSAREHGTDRMILTPAKAQLLNRAVVNACDAVDGLKDGLIDDPRACTPETFDIGALRCRGAEADDCLTPAQIEAAQKIWRGPVNPRTGALIYPGPPIGAEAGWPTYWGTTAPTRADFWKLWTFNDPAWDPWQFDFDRDLTVAAQKVGSLVDHNRVDLDAFKARGGKLLAYQGWADPVVSAHDTIAYYEKVRKAQGSPAGTDDFFRLFLAPGMDHCRGGPGPNVFGNAGLSAPSPDASNDLLKALDRWVEQGRPPERLVAATVVDGKAVRTRPLCAYPKRAIYGGSGSTDDAISFACR